MITVVDEHPELLGFGIDEPAGVVVRGNIVEVIGSGRVAVYDIVRHAVVSSDPARDEAQLLML